MGWFGTWQYGRKTMKQVKEYLLKEECGDGFENEKQRVDVVHATVRFGIAYFAIKQTPKINGVLLDEANAKTFALVVLWRQDNQEFAMKTIDEFCGPVQFRGCPKSLIKKLSPLDKLVDKDDMTYQWAKNWREAVLSQYKR